MILYLHGFRSSPESYKARMMRAHCAAHEKLDQFICPQLPASPAAAMHMIENIASQYAAQTLTIVGSSLGGYYATALAEKIGCKAVLLNPAVRPAKDLQDHVGELTIWHSHEPFEFKSEYIAELEAIAVNSITRPERYFLIAATGDEILDWQTMTDHYQGARQKVINGSDHGLSDFEHYIDEVIAFCSIE
jgi:predicted esterase YcpF (UPF0227 family)